MTATVPRAAIIEALDRIRKTPRQMRYAWRPGHFVASYCHGKEVRGFRRRGEAVVMETYRRLGTNDDKPTHVVALPPDLARRAARLIDGTDWIPLDTTPAGVRG